MCSTKAAVEQRGQCSLRPSAVGRSMLRPIAKQKGEPRTTRPSTSHREHQERGETGGNVVGDVIDAGCPAAEGTIALRAIAYHRVEGVHGLIDQHPGNAQQSIPKERGHHAVGEVLGERFQRRRAHLLCCESPSVASHDTGHLPSSVVQAAVQCLEDHGHLAAQRPPRQAEKYQQRCRPSRQQPRQKKEQGECERYQQRSLQATMGSTIEPMFPKAYPPTDAHHRMGQPGGVA